MSTTPFPTLSTGAIAQYSSQRVVIYRTEVSRFVDGSEQRYPQLPSPALRWVIRLDLLSDREMQALVDFHVAHRGSASTFPFTDPWSGVEYPHCCFEKDDADTEMTAESQSRTQIIIRSTRD